MLDRKGHWEKVYQTKQDNEVSWYQENPATSLDLIKKHLSSNDDALVDIGGGNSNLVLELLQKGHSNLTVLDISKYAMARTKNKIGANSDQINWVESNILDFVPTRNYQLWHDRATFHFLTTKTDIEKYVQVLKNSVYEKGKVVLATFSESGPLKCSGLDTCQYSPEKIEGVFGNDFKLIESLEEVHNTPFDTEQNFQYFVLERIVK